MAQCNLIVIFALIAIAILLFIVFWPWNRENMVPSGPQELHWKYQKCLNSSRKESQCRQLYMRNLQEMRKLAESQALPPA